MGNRATTLRQEPSVPEPARPALSPNILQVCPPEIWEEIIRYLAGDLEALKSFALLSRSILPLVQAELFRTITLRGRLMCKLFLEMVTGNPMLGTHVRTLHIIDRFESPEMVAWISGRDSELSIQLARHFAGVTTLRLCLFRSVLREQDAEQAAMHINAFFSHFASVRSLSLEDCRFRSIKDLHELLVCFRASLHHLGLKRVVMMQGPRMADFAHAGFRTVEELEQTLDLISTHSLPKLESLTMERVMISHLSTWMLHSGTASGIKTMSLTPSHKDDIGTASALLTGGCEGLQNLELNMEDFQWWSQFPTGTARLADLSELKSLRSITITTFVWRNWSPVPLLATLPANGALEQVEISDFEVALDSWQDSLERALPELDRHVTQARFPHLRDIHLKPVFYQDVRSDEMMRMMPIAHGRRILRITPIQP